VCTDRIDGDQVQLRGLGEVPTDQGHPEHARAVGREEAVVLVALGRGDVAVDGPGVAEPVRQGVQEASDVRPAPSTRDFDGHPVIVAAAVPL
jgi:hypothetical protein